MSLGHLIEEVVDPHRNFGKEINILLMPSETSGPDNLEPVGRRNPAILYGLGNIIENAVDFARTRVDISAVWDDEIVSVTIADDGSGFQPDILGRLGEPYVTARPSNPRHIGPDDESGLGLGFFIAKTLLERSGAVLTLENRPHPDHGAVVKIVWPRASMDDVEEPANL